MTGNSIPGRTWEEVLERATESDQGEMHLTAILAAALALSPDLLHERRVGDYPPGVPPKSTVRKAAQVLLDMTDPPRTDRSSARRALAWTQLLRLPQGEVITDSAPQGEIIQAVENCRHALAELGDHGDPTDRAIVNIQFARFLRRAHQTVQVVELLTQDVEVVRHEKQQASEAPSILRDAPFLENFLPDKIATKRAEILYQAYKDLGLLEESMQQVHNARAYASRYADLSVDDLLRTMILEGDLHRRRRDVPAMLRLENDSKVLASRYSYSPAAWRSHSSQTSANAGVFQDFSRALELRYERLRHRLQIDLGQSFDDRPSIPELMNCVKLYRRLNSKSGITWLGNIAFDIVSGHVQSGDTASDPQLRKYAEGLLDVAEAAWEGFATNGVSSLLYGRARLALMSGDAPTEKLTADLLTANRTAYRSGTTENALKTAVRYGIPGSEAVKERLNELLGQLDQTANYVAYAKTLGLLAEWSWRAADADVDWARVESETLAATRVLRIEGVSIAPESEAIAWMTAARAVAEIDPSEKTEQLRRLLRGIRCITELMLTIATTVDRQRMGGKFRTLFVEASELAVELGDHSAADLIMEAARRDRVGLLLAELARNPDIDTAIRAAALAVQDSGSATVDSAAHTAHTGENTEEGGDDESGVRGRSTAIAVDRATAVRAAESVLGPLSALADADHLDAVTATAVLDGRDPSPATTAILQLLPLAPDPNATADRVRLLRRCTIATPGTAVHQFTDCVEIPHLYLEYTRGTLDRLFVGRKKYTPSLLPPPLMELLTATPATAPLRLMIVPTGFFHIPFDALPVTADTHVLDHALVSIHGSLTSALSLMRLEEQRTPSPALAIYDHELKHAQPELDALLTALDRVQRVDSLPDLGHEMTAETTQPFSLLAMAVHGSADDHGWGQAKKLRDDEGNTVWVTAAQALSWTVPRLCVLASCNTPISAPNGIEVGGFPLALMLRGATTVIGGLYNIDDKATSDIMITFWRRLGSGESALSALRNAKLDYLQINPDYRRLWPEYWAGLTVYGAPNT